MNQNINVFPNNINFIPNPLNNPTLFNNPNMFIMNNNMNNNFNQNMMNNNLQITQMYQMANLYNQNNQNINNNNINFVNQNQKILVDKIIEFYQNKGRKFMNYNEEWQIKQLLNNLDTNCPLLKEGNNIPDPLHYIKEKKKIIQFINHDFKFFNVKIPISIDKKTLYAVASLFSTCLFSSFLLVHLNCILDEDESSINSISDGDFVIIIEDIYYLDHSYFNSFRKLKYSDVRKNVPIKISNSFSQIIHVPDNIKLSQLLKALIFHFGCEYYFYYQGKKLKEYDYNIDNKIILEGYPIEVIQSDFQKLYFTIFGKEIDLKVKFEHEKERNLSHNYKIGTLNSIKELVKIIEIQNYIKVKAFYLDGKQINIEEDRSFISLGIKEDSKAVIMVN